jgi:hypothetical protein
MWLHKDDLSRGYQKWVQKYDIVRLQCCLMSIQTEIFLECMARNDLDLRLVGRQSKEMELDAGKTRRAGDCHVLLCNSSSWRWLPNPIYARIRGQSKSILILE